MKRVPYESNPRLAALSDEELANEARMMVAELEGHHRELQRRGYEARVSHYTDGSCQAQYERVTREEL